MFSSEVSTRVWERRENLPCLSGGIVSLCRKEYQIWDVRRKECEGKLVWVTEVRKLISEKSGVSSHTHICLLISYRNFTMREKSRTHLLEEVSNYRTTVECSPWVFLHLIHCIVANSGAVARGKEEYLPSPNWWCYWLEKGFFFWFLEE